MARLVGHGMAVPAQRKEVASVVYVCGSYFITAFTYRADRNDMRYLPYIGLFVRYGIVSISLRQKRPMADGALTAGEVQQFPVPRTRDRQPLCAPHGTGCYPSSISHER
jgi:hypothetical protein